MRRFQPGILTLAVVTLVATSLPAASAVTTRSASSSTSPGKQIGPAPGELRQAFVHFRPGTRHKAAFLRLNGLRPVLILASVDVVFAEGRSRAFDKITQDRRVTHLEANEQLELLNDTATIATRVQEVRAATSSYRDPSGRTLDGAGVGVAVIDTGVLAVHPDLSSRMGKNYKVVCAGCPLVETQFSDTTSGHGTHVAGIVAGTGSESEGRFAGVAPGSTLYGYGVGETLYALWAVVAFDHIVRNYDEFDPRIRVVTNSYGSPGPFDPDSTVSKLVAELVERGTTVVWAAGNGSGDGSTDTVVDDAKNPMPGVIGVGNFDDSDVGDRDGGMYSGSSRGLKGSPETYPDIAAPGTTITSTCIQELQPVCHLGFGITTDYHPWYSTIGGTSMAAPHVAGIAALLYQADPSLTPALVEDLIQDSAYKFIPGAPYEPDPQNPGGTVAFDKGAGLIDASAALELLNAPDPDASPKKKGAKRSRSRSPRGPRLAL